MAGYRYQIRKACRKLGRTGGTFTYIDVMGAIPTRLTRPTEWETIRTLQHAKYLEVAEDGRYRKLTKYRLRRDDINARAEVEAPMDGVDDEVTQLLSQLVESEPRTCSITMSCDGAAVVIDQSLDVTVRGDATKARAAWLHLLPETRDEDATTYGVNREFIASMHGDDHRATAEDGDFALEFVASHSLVDCGHLINALRANGGVQYFDRGQRGRRGER